jgi:hypothetical protein
MRVKGGIVTRRRHKKILRLAEGYYSAKRKLFRKAHEQVMKIAALRLSGPPPAQAGFPTALDYAPQRGMPRARNPLSRVHSRPERARYRP